MLDVLRERMGGAAFDIARKNGAIELAPFEVMRGRSWRHAFVLLDEAQNSTPEQMKMFLTRIGENCQVVVNGDVDQNDIKETSGLRVLLDLVARKSLPVPVIAFGHGDIVRSEICAMWARAFHEAGIWGQSLMAGAPTLARLLSRIGLAPYGEAVRTQRGAAACTPRTASRSSARPE